MISWKRTTARTWVRGLVAGWCIAACSWASAAQTRYADAYATSGDGSNATPWKGWESAFAVDTHVIFKKGFYETPVTAITLGSNTAITGVDGAVVRWPSNRTSVNAMFYIPGGTDGVVIDGLQFEPGVAVPQAGLSSQGGGSYVQLGSAGTTTTITNVSIVNNRFGVMRYADTQTGIDVAVFSSATNLIVSRNRMDAAPSNVTFSGGDASVAFVYRNVSLDNNIAWFSQAHHNFGYVFNVGTGGGEAVRATFENFRISDNVLRGHNGAIAFFFAGTTVNISGNTAMSDNMDSFLHLGTAAQEGEMISHVAVVGNTCYALEPSGDPLKVPNPACQLQISQADNVTVVGNEIRGMDASSRVGVSAASNVQVVGNTVLRGSGGVAPPPYDACYSVHLSHDVSIVGNRCTDTRYYVVHVTGIAPASSNITISDNTLYQSASYASSFVGFEDGSGVLVTGNAVRGQNLSSTFISGSATNLVRFGNVESVSDTGFRIGSDQVSDITGAGLTVASGALKINNGAGLTFSSGALTVDSTVATLTGSQTLQGKDLTSTTNIFPRTSTIGFVAATVPGTVYCGANTGRTNATESNVSVGFPRSVLRELRCKSSVQPGAGNSWTVNVRSNAGSVGISCAISGTNTQCSDLTNSTTLSDGNLLALRVDRSGSPSTSASVTCSLAAGP